MRVLRVSHSAVVDALARAGARLCDAVATASTSCLPPRWDEGGRPVALCARAPVSPSSAHGPSAPTRRSSSTTRARSGGRSAGPVDVIDIHEEPFALATAEVLLLRALRRQRAPYVLYSAQNIDKRYPVPFRWLERWALRHASGISVCNDAAGRIAERKGFPGRARIIHLGTDLSVFTPPSAYAGDTGLAGTSAASSGFAGTPRRGQGRRRAARGGRRRPGRCVLRLAGDGPERRRWTQLARRARASPTASSSSARSTRRGAARLLPLPRRARRPLADDARLGRAVRPGRPGGDGLRHPRRGQRQRGPARGRRRAALVVPEGDAAELAKALAAVVLRPRRRAAGCVPRGSTGLPRRPGSGSRTSTRRSYRAATQAVVRGRSRDERRPLEVVVVAYGQPELLAAALAPLGALVGDRRRQLVVA